MFKELQSHLDGVFDPILFGPLKMLGLLEAIKSSYKRWVSHRSLLFSLGKWDTAIEINLTAWLA